MIKQYRHIIRPTDPRVNIKFPQEIYQDLKDRAKRNARRLSDEVLARILATLEQCGTSESSSKLMQLIYESNLKDKG